MHPTIPTKVKGYPDAFCYRSFYMRLWNQLYEWLHARENLFFFALILVHLIPIWLFTYFPSQDGPAHIENANILLEYDHPDRTIFREYYQINKHLKPNWFGHLVLAGLMYIVPILVAEKIFLSGYIILLPISVRYAVRAIRPDNGFLAIMAFPFIYNFMLHMGFYNFSYSLPMFFFVVGYWLKYKEALTPRVILTLALLLLLLYFCHIVSLVMAYMVISLLTIWVALFDLAKKDTGKWLQDIRTYWKVFRVRALPVFFGFLPSLLLAVVFLSGQRVVGADKWSFWNLSKHILALSSLWSYETYELWFSTMFVCLFAAISFHLLAPKIVHRRWSRWDGLLLVFCACVLIYFTTPDSISGGNYITPRLLLYPFFTLILWFGTGLYNRVTKIRIMIATTGIALALLGLNMTKYAELNNYLEEYLSGIQLIEHNTTLLPLSFSHKGQTSDGQALSRRVRPFLFASGYIAADRHIVELHNYEARTGYFATIYHPSLDPFQHIWTNKSLYDRPKVDFLTYPERTGGNVDYVLVWGLRDEISNSENVQSILRQIERGYNLIYTSEKRLMHLYRRKDR